MPKFRERIYAVYTTAKNIQILKSVTTQFHLGRLISHVSQSIVYVYCITPDNMTN